MTWGAIGAAAVSVVGSVIANKNKGSSSPSAAADPFSGERGQYQPMLQDLMKSNTTAGTANAAQIQDLASHLGNTSAMTRMQQMTQPGFQYSPQDPSYQFRYQQGLDATTRQAAASGMGRSGNVLAELETYGQGMASQEYGNEFQRMLGMNQQQVAGQQAQIGALSGIDINAANLYQNAYQRLATLSGATVGSPGTAGNLLQNQQAQASAGFQQLGGAVAPAIRNWFSNPTTPSPYQANQMGAPDIPVALPDAAIE